MPFVDLTGKKFGRLTVIKRVDSDKWGQTQWLCVCECGQTCIVLGRNLRSGHTSSCGCLHRDTAAALFTKHGLSRTKIYKTWQDIVQRCTNPKKKQYKDYGGRGIKVCDEWKNDFMAFYNYVSALPHFDEEGYSLDRINNDGNYEPGNVRWADKKTQANNTRRQQLPKSDLMVIRDRNVYTDSLTLAKFFEKEHRNVLRAIENELANLRDAENCQIILPKILTTSNALIFEPVEIERAFIKGEYKDAKGEMRPMYYLNRDGFMQIALGFTGKKASVLRWIFIQEFNRMETELKKKSKLLQKLQPAITSSTTGNSPT